MGGDPLEPPRRYAPDNEPRKGDDPLEPPQRYAADIPKGTTP